MSKKEEKEQYNLRIGKLFSGVSNVASTCSWLGISLSAIVGLIRRSWLFGIPAAILVSVLLLLRFCKRNHRRIIGWIQGALSPNFPYRLTLWEIEYEYKSMTEMRYRADYEVRAMQTGVDHIRVRYNWSGETEDNPIAPTPVQGDAYQTEKLLCDGKEYGYSYYKVMSRNRFNRKDDPFRLGVQIDPLKVGKRPVSHHLLASISMATDVLVMRVLLPANICPTRVECFEYLHATDDYHWHMYKEDIKPLEDGRYKIEWSILHPIYGGKYVIKWDPQILTDGHSVSSGTVKA